MIPILYSANDMIFMDNGIGALSDTKSCLCTEVLNGEYEVELEMPIGGAFTNYVQVNRIIKVKPNYGDDPQPFRIYSVEKDIEGLMTVKAAHISYDTNGIPIMPFEAENVEAAVDNLNNNRQTLIGSPFQVIVYFEKEGTMKVTSPSLMKNLLGDGSNGILSIYGGEYHYDWYYIDLLEKRGVDKGIVFRSGKNLVDFNYEANSEEAYSSIFGFWKKNDNPDNNVYGSVFTVSNNLAFDKIQILEVTSEQMDIGSSTPTQEDIDAYVEKYLQDNDICTPKYNMDITYAEDDNIVHVNLGDTVGVVLPEYEIRSIARCTKVVFDCLLERNESIELGEASSGIAEEIASLSD